MLAGILYCDKCSRVMHRRKVYNKRKDGSRQYNIYYRCDGTVRNHSTCKNMIPLAWLDSKMDEAMRGRIDPYMTRVIDPGEKDHQDEIDEIDLEIDDLDKSAPDYLDRITALVAERKQLVDAPVKEPSVIWVQTGETYAHRWAKLASDSQRREALQDWGITVYAVKGQEPRIEGYPTIERMPIYRQSDATVEN